MSVDVSKLETNYITVQYKLTIFYTIYIHSHALRHENG